LAEERTDEGGRDNMTENEQDYYEERAAILEFDAGLSRYEAEHKAMQEVEAKRTLFKGGK
jgi:hypothetical protein